jgi:hypothetical protein
LTFCQKQLERRRWLWSSAVMIPREETKLSQSYSFTIDPTQSGPGSKSSAN